MSYKTFTLRVLKDMRKECQKGEIAQTCEVCKYWQGVDIGCPLIDEDMPYNKTDAQLKKYKQYMCNNYEEDNNL